MSTPLMDAVSFLGDCLDRLESELKRGVDFWLTHSHDEEHGGFFNCLTREGIVFDDTKYGWLQGRQVWMYCKLYREREDFRRDDLLRAAIAGGEFLIKHFYRCEDHRCYFTVQRNGLPIYMQRKLFTESFFLLAMTELFRVTGEKKYQELADAVFGKIRYWAREDDSELGRPHLAGNPRANELAIPMMFLCVLQEMCLEDENLLKKHKDDMKWCTQHILSHLQRDKRFVLETVSPEGIELEGSRGRFMNPGHAIEAGWFLLRQANLLDDDELRKTAVDHFIVRSFANGWDSAKYDGGLIYFLDIDGRPSIPLESNMKLWWPHCEAIIAFLMAYRTRRDDVLLQHFKKVYDYSMKYFRDDGEVGEWFGYLARNGSRDENPLKGGPYKGCFHTLRCFHMATQLIREILKTELVKN
ncbi:N-acylglucosamine 2-epimerase-like isoform X2 [Oscarella lobularis]|uniref:N-acylglucosamine 2-epimerase-like isoform X2 n=1 Tax=Oscarella lobularis TaxID=121494 RepID=UPI00331432DE